MSFFKLNKEVSETTDDIDADDVLNTKNQLKNLGYYQTPDYGMTKISDRSMFDGIRKFQTDNKLTADGIAKPGGETESTFNKILRNGEYASTAAQQGLSLGWADEAEGVAGGIGYGIGSLNKKWNKTDETFGQAFKRGYIKKRDERRANLEEGYKRNPVLAGGMEMASATINPLNKLVAPVSKNAPLALKNKQALNGAMRMGTAYGLGTGEGNLFNQAKSRAIGAVGGAAGQTASKFINKNITQGLNSQVLRFGINSSVENATSNWVQKRLKDKNL